MPQLDVFANDAFQNTLSEEGQEQELRQRHKAIMGSNGEQTTEGYLAGPSGGSCCRSLCLLQFRPPVSSSSSPLAHSVSKPLPLSTSLLYYIQPSLSHRYLSPSLPHCFLQAADSGHVYFLTPFGFPNYKLDSFITSPPHLQTAIN